MEHGQPKNACVIIGTPGSGCYRVVRDGRDAGRMFTRYSDALDFCEAPATDDETIEAARKLFASDTPGDKLARRLIEIAERAEKREQARRDAMFRKWDELYRRFAK